MPPTTASWLQRLGTQARGLFQQLHRAVAAEGPHVLTQGMTDRKMSLDGLFVDVKV